MTDVDDVLAARRELEDSAWGSVWLYGDWREITRQMPLEEKELAADAVARWSERMQRCAAGTAKEPAGLRWWRDESEKRYEARQDRLYDRILTMHRTGR